MTQRSKRSTMAQPKRGSTPTTLPVTFILPLPPNMANARWHWAAKHRARQEYFLELANLYILGLIPKPPAEPFPYVFISSTLYLLSQMDEDNALARIKWPVDWLKRHGYIVDDRIPHARFTIPAQVVSRKAQSRLELTLTAGAGSAVSETERDE